MNLWVYLSRSIKVCQSGGSAIVLQVFFRLLFCMVVKKKDIKWIFSWLIFCKQNYYNFLKYAIEKSKTAFTVYFKIIKIIFLARDLILKISSNVAQKKEKFKYSWLYNCTFTFLLMTIGYYVNERNLKRN